MIGIGAFTSSDDIQTRDGQTKFWLSEPTGIWEPKVCSSLAALSLGADVTLLSGASGVGKSSQYNRLLQTSLGERLGTIYDSSAEIDDRNPDAGIQLIDETSSLVFHEPEVADAVLARVGTKQLAIIVTGTTNEHRLRVREQVLGKLRTHKPSLSFYDAGDVAAAYVEPQRASMVISALGGDSSAVKLVENVSALRSLHWFKEIFLNGVAANSQSGHRFDAKGVRGILRQMAAGQYPYEFKAATFESYYTPGISFLLQTFSVQRDDVKVLHELSDVALPSRAQSVRLLGYDPYDCD